MQDAEQLLPVDEESTLRHAILEETTNFYEAALTEERAADLASARGLTLETIRRFRIGFSAPGLAQHLKTKGFDLNDAERVGVLKQTGN
ncbi:MAG TPA: hypothetical protein PLW55_18865, partial [Leptospiraceae bacterium]|nr:hypothetical protein [Leptospiraceae bacterium]